MSPIELAAGLSAGIWLALLFARGGFWRVREIRPAHRLPGVLPRVAVVIPARDEAPVIGRAIGSLAGQDYRGVFHIFLANDQSSDETSEVAQAAADPTRLSVVRAGVRPAGWTGKVWAVSQGVAAAAHWAPDYYLLTDADIVHAPDSLSRLVAQAEGEGCELVSRMVMLRCETFAEKALIPAFVFFFFLLYPPRWIADPRHKTAGAAGGCILIRRAALEAIGGMASVRGELIDDCALARAVKRKGGSLRLEPAQETRSIREYGSFGEIGQMISRTAFTQLHHCPWLLAATVAGMGATYVLPPLLAATPAGALAWLLMMLAYAPTLRYYGRSMLWAPALPLVALFYTGATIHSAVAYWSGRGGDWKGRVQDPRPAG